MYGKEGLRLWRNPKSDLRAWSNADLFYEYWSSLNTQDRTLSQVFPEISRTVFRTILTAFDDGWNPSLDAEWLSFFNNRAPLLEKPIFCLGKIKCPEAYLKCEDIENLFSEGRGSKYIANKLQLSPSNVSGVINKLKSGWKPMQDKHYLFAKERLSTTEELE